MYMYAVLTFESVNEILWCYHSNETSLAVLLNGTICFSIFYKLEFRIFLEFWCLVLLGVKGLNKCIEDQNMIKYEFSGCLGIDRNGLKMLRKEMFKNVLGCT